MHDLTSIHASPKSSREYYDSERNLLERLDLLEEIVRKQAHAINSLIVANGSTGNVADRDDPPGHENTRTESDKEVTSIFVGFTILFVTLTLGLSLKTMAMSHSNESKLARIVEVLSVKYPGIMLEVQTLSTHQEMASAPVYFMARMMSLVFGTVSSTAIILFDKLLKYGFSVILVAGVAYLYLSHRPHNGEPREPFYRKLLMTPRRA